jgi:negative regulator of replication initiation
MVIYKGYQIKPHKIMPTCYVVVTDGKGGKIPAVLDSLFTSTGIAKETIDNYLAKGVKNGEARTEG